MHFLLSHSPQSQDRHYYPHFTDEKVEPKDIRDLFQFTRLVMMKLGLTYSTLAHWHL